jgi:hypothetical protein
MEPHFHNGDEVSAVDTLCIQKGDFIVFTAGKYGTLVKQVTYCPGDEMPSIGALNSWKEIHDIVPDNLYIVEGTSINSIDSKTFGPIHRDYILGKVVNKDA